MCIRIMYGYMYLPIFLSVSVDSAICEIAPEIENTIKTELTE